MNRSRVLYLPVLVVLIATGMAAGPSVFAAQNQTSYMLLNGSTLIENIGLAPPIIVPLRGTFQLVLREENPPITTYDVKDIVFHTPNGIFSYSVTGTGTYVYDTEGDFATMQHMQLEVQINDFSGLELDSGKVLAHRDWPMMEIDVRQEPVDLFHSFGMGIVAAPLREIWFSTGSDFTSGTLNHPVSSGDLLSHTGRVVRSNSGLVGKLDIMPIVPGLGLDAFDISPEGEILISLSKDALSKTLGDLQHGDLLSQRGGIVQSNQQLTSAFVPEPPPPDVGLDAVHAMEDGEILFSIQGSLFSENLGVMLRRGDLLSDKGLIVRTNEKLLEKFDPVEGQGDVGLDAIYVWPHGEIWFSTTEHDFESKTLGKIGHGDLLSSNGSIVFRNRELLQGFTPQERISDFGLDSLFVVTKELLSKLSITKDGDVVTLTWEEFGDRQYTVQWTEDLVYGTWQNAPGDWPVSELMWMDIVSGEVMQRFYRLESGGLYTDAVGFIKVLPIEDGLTMVSVPLVPADNRLNGEPGCVGDMIRGALMDGFNGEDATIWKWDLSTQGYKTAFLFDARWWDDETGGLSTMTFDAGECFWLMRRTREQALP